MTSKIEEQIEKTKLKNIKDKLVSDLEIPGYKPTIRVNLTITYEKKYSEEKAFVDLTNKFFPQPLDLQRCWIQIKEIMDKYVEYVESKVYDAYYVKKTNGFNYSTISNEYFQKIYPTKKNINIKN